MASTWKQASTRTAASSASTHVPVGPTTLLQRAADEWHVVHRLIIMAHIPLGEIPLIHDRDPTHPEGPDRQPRRDRRPQDRKSTRLNSSHVATPYAVFS